MRMRRFSGAVALLGIAGLLVSGCGSSGSDGTSGSSGSTASGASSGTSASSTDGSQASGASEGSSGASSASSNTSDGPAKNVTVWIQNGAYSQDIQDYLAKWGPEHNINVKVDVQASDQYAQAIVLALKTGKAPDIFPATKTNQLVDAGYLLPLDDVLSDDIKAQYSDSMKAPSQFVWGGKNYAVPTTTNTIRLAYNKDIFTKAGLDPDKPPTTISEIETDCTAIAKVSDVYCFGLPLKWAGFVAWDLAPLAVAGTDVHNTGFYDASTGKIDFSSAAPVVKLYRDMIANKWAYPGASSLDNDPMRSAFAEGKIGMFVSASWDIGLINDQFKTKADWAATQLPVPDGQQHQQNPMSIGSGYSINAKTADPEAATAVLEAIVGSDLQGELANAGLVISVNQDVKVDGTDLAPQFAEYALSDGDVKQNPTPTGAVSITGKTYQDVVASLILGSGDIDSALSDLTKRYNAALDSSVSAGDVNLDDYK